MIGLTGIDILYLQQQQTYKYTITLGRLDI